MQRWKNLTLVLDKGDERGAARQGEEKPLHPILTYSLSLDEGHSVLIFWLPCVYLELQLPVHSSILVVDLLSSNLISLIHCRKVCIVGLLSCFHDLRNCLVTAPGNQVIPTSHATGMQESLTIAIEEKVCRMRVISVCVLINTYVLMCCNCKS